MTEFIVTKRNRFAPDVETVIFRSAEIDVFVGWCIDNLDNHDCNLRLKNSDVIVVVAAK